MVAINNMLMTIGIRLTNPNRQSKRKKNTNNTIGETMVMAKSGS